MLIIVALIVGNRKKGPKGPTLVVCPPAVAQQCELYMEHRQHAADGTRDG